jgi:hypothetical protein
VDVDSSSRDTVSKMESLFAISVYDLEMTVKKLIDGRKKALEEVV